MERYTAARRRLRRVLAVAEATEMLIHYDSCPMAHGGAALRARSSLASALAAAASALAASARAALASCEGVAIRLSLAADDVRPPCPPRRGTVRPRAIRPAVRAGLISRSRPVRGLLMV